MSTILLVEDNYQQFEAMARRLEGRGHKVVHAGDGPEAIKIAASDNIDLVIMDIKLPEMDGYDVTREIRKQPQGGQVPIIAITAFALVEDRSKALAAGCDDYHAKPIAFIQLMRQIDALLNENRAKKRER